VNVERQKEDLSRDADQHRSRLIGGDNNMERGKGYSGSEENRLRFIREVKPVAGDREEE